MSACCAVGKARPSPPHRHRFDLQRPVCSKRWNQCERASNMIGVSSYKISRQQPVWRAQMYDTTVGSSIEIKTSRQRTDREEALGIPDNEWQEGANLLSGLQSMVQFNNFTQKLERNLSDPMRCTCDYARRRPVHRCIIAKTKTGERNHPLENLSIMCLQKMATGKPREFVAINYALRSSRQSGRNTIRGHA